MPDADLIRSVEQFLYREARLLDERRFHDWLALFTDDVQYRMMSRSNRYPRSSKAIAGMDAAWQDADQMDELGLFDEDIRTLTARVARLDTGMAWAEDPPSRTRHLITNVELAPDASDAALTAHSNFMVYRSRGETEQDFYVGARTDRLRRIDGAWKIADRRMVLDQNVLTSKNLSIFF
ncbi:MAG TPA: 3-phenylpropionate/cinnamic acid dioxygenase subunit beta [Acetobacteraceae bacterium]|nr:3-phenylpropionate/cinnamic acid dioxygenase subunit beta [Acetobacteraceae bacterium]